MTKAAGTGEEQAEASGPQGERGTLVVVGTGIQWGGQTTLAAQRAIQAADRVLFAVADAGTVAWLRSLDTEILITLTPSCKSISSEK